MITAQSLLDYMSPATILALLQDMSEIEAWDFSDTERVRYLAVAQLVRLQGEEQTRIDLASIAGVSV